MRIFDSIAGMRGACRERLRVAGEPALLGLVPTMGALHAGHVSLVRAAKSRCGLVAASIFVNPLQFGPREDLARYPRPFADDCALLEREGVDLLFAPSVEQMYPHGHGTTFVESPGVTQRLDGRFREGHFRGVETVVTKLFHIVEPDVAFFGQKDAAQVAVLRTMVRDLDFAVELAVCPTVREADGLALSSRNRYLSPEERTHALALFASLDRVAQSAASTPLPGLLERWRGQLAAAEGIELEYAEIVDPDTLEPLEDLASGGLAVVAARVGQTRLIDNLLLQPVLQSVKHARTLEETLR
jgi:pantoate--beta-alanine ligase